MRGIVRAERADDSSRIRDIADEHGAVPNNPPRQLAAVEKLLRQDAYKGRSAIEGI